jgi:chromosome transmission fidelity protein 18
VVLKALQASSEDQNDDILPETQVMHEKLWVDKYAPNSFTELLSDEQTNREVSRSHWSKFLKG